LGTLLSASAASAQVTSFSGFGAGGGWHSFVTTDTPLLDSFFFRFPDHDNHVEDIALLPSGDLIRIGFQDESEDDRFFYNIEYRSTPRTTGTNPIVIA